jgi:hypothetical protein
MSTSTPVLSYVETKAFLTQADLEKLEGAVSDERLQAIIDEGCSPYITVRGKYVRLFDVLSLLGTL